MIRYTVRDSVAEILLDHPPVNAIDHGLADALLAALERARGDEGVRAVIFGSAVPGRFSAGLDLPVFLDLAPESKHALIEKLYTRLTEAQFALGKPSIAAVTGTTRGGGMTLAISCDMILADESANFAYPEIDIGLLPGIHYTHLHRIVGRYRAFELLFTGLAIDAQEAQRLGLVNRVCRADELMDEARRVAQILAGKSPALMRLGRAAFLRGIDSGYRTGVAGAVETLDAAAASADSRAAMSGFIEKQKARRRKS
ncbi:MAG: enoyl-CoA hydratase/isomerase family protein [Alphaproteobacteria bacterium]|nr:enoyl-CoA hydratase/isomerase family protein [Alphaproteobacteria bacterium]